MRRLGAIAAVLAAGLAGLAAGAAGMARLQDSGSPTGPVPASHQGPVPWPGATPGPGAVRGTGTAPTPAPSHTPEAAPSPAVLLAWTPLGLDPGLVAAAAGDPAVSATSVVRGGTLDLVGSRTAGGTVVDAPAAGWAIPLDAIAVDPAAHARFASGSDRAALAGLGPGQALLGATSAELRHLGPADTIELAGGHTLTIVGVASDSAVGGAELVLDRPTGEGVGLTTNRYLLAAYDGGNGGNSDGGDGDGGRAALEGRLRAALAEDEAVRFRGPGETPFLRNGDAVLPQVVIKHRFGEFAYRRGAAGSGSGTDEFQQDARWQAENLVSVDLPIIGRARCHRAVVEALAGALDEVVAANLAGLVDPEGFAGCWNARTTRSGNAVSRHAWGVAIDLNFGANPTGLSSVQDPRLVAIFGRWGFTEGSGWLVPDAGHFEYVSAPRP